MQELIDLWTSGLAAGGVDPDHIYTHVAFVSKVAFAELQAEPGFPPDLTYEQFVNFAPSTQQPSVAFVTTGRPGFTTYPGDGVFDQIQDERSAHGDPAWASSEGTNLIPGGVVGGTGLTMDAYLAQSFDHGATLVNIFGWGIGGPSMATTNPFQIVAESADSIAAYQGVLAR